MAANLNLPDPRDIVATLVRRARAAQEQYQRYTQEQVDEVVTAAAWAIMKPENNRVLADLAVADSGLGNAQDKFDKNYRKTLGLLRDLKGAKSVGVIAEYPQLGLVEIARPVGVVAVITPSTNPRRNAGEQDHQYAQGPQRRRHRAFAQGSFHLCQVARVRARRVCQDRRTGRSGATPARSPVTKDLTHELMRQADLVAATGSQANIRAAYASGTPAVGVGAGNVVVIVDSSADPADAAAKIVRSKTFDNATSCSSENSAVIHADVYDAMLAELAKLGGVLLDAKEKLQLEGVMFPNGKLSSATTAQSAPRIAQLAGLERNGFGTCRFIMVEESGIGRSCPFSGEKLAPVLAIYKARDFDEAFRITHDIYDYQGKGHSVGIHTRDEGHVMRLGLELEVCRVIVNQAHCIATGGSFDNGLPFSLSMGCGTWGATVSRRT